jgi:negative regulator of sigma E activity
MSFELEKALRETLQREEPAADFTERLLARIAAEERAPVAVRTTALHTEAVRESRWQQLLNAFEWANWRWATAGALACILVFTAVGVHQYRDQQRARLEIAEGERAKEQVLLALQIASSKLNTAQRKLRESGARDADSKATQP